MKKWIYWTVLLLLSVLPLTARAQSVPFQSGDRVVIRCPASEVALSAKTVDFYQAGVPVTVADGIPVGYGETEIWTATEMEDGSWAFENGGCYLGLDSETKQLILDSRPQGWRLLEQEAGYQLRHPEGERYLAWYTGRKVFCSAMENLGQNLLCFYRIPEEPENTEAAEETVPVTEGTIPVTDPTGETAPESPEEATSEPREPDTGEWQLYFGQLHAHTADSDGVGTVEDAFRHARWVAGLDFFAVTEHSDSFDNDVSGTLTGDGSSLSRVWAAGKAAARAATDEAFVGIYGFEISWNQGQGHMSTFHTPGWISRDREGYSMYRDGLENYYEALTAVPDSVSQFNHPGPLYGDFKDFAYHSPQADARVTLIEVGSGARSEYESAYEAYNRALDQGWHLAPTNNQNNHGGSFGDADTNRTVILASELTEAGIYDALRNYRVYATEDADLRIFYTLNGSVMGSSLSVAKMGDWAEISVCLHDPTDVEWGTVDVISSGGAVVSSAAAGETVRFSLPATAAYYYIRVTQPDGDVAVTAPVWIRQREDLGIAALESAWPLTRAGQPQNILLTLYNNEAENLTVTGITLSDGAGNLLGTDTGETVLSRFGEEAFSFPVCFEKDGVYTLEAAVTGIYQGEQVRFTAALEISVLPEAITGDVLIDGTHGSPGEYGELISLAAAQQTAVYIERDTVTAAQLEGCRVLIVPAPDRPLEEAFLELVENYVNQGGTLLLLGRAGGSAEINILLDALGLSMSLHADTAVDEVSNGGQPEQLFTGVIQPSVWTEGIPEGQIFAHVNGCTLDSGKGQWLVKSRTGDVLLAAEGNVILAGSDFLEDALLAMPDHAWALPFANRTVAENLLDITQTVPEVTPIGALRGALPGGIYLAEGLVTAGTHNVNTTFPDTIYIQDGTGGIAAVGYSAHGLEPGRRVQIVGCLEEKEGNPQLRILSMEILEKNDPILPEPAEIPLDCAVRGGELLQLTGTVVSLEANGEAVRFFEIQDAQGNRATVWIGDTIFSGSLGRNELARKVVQPGNRVSAVGLCHLLEGEVVLRLRDCDEVRLLWEPPGETDPPATEMPTEAPGEIPEEEPMEMPTEPDVPDQDKGTDGNPATGDSAFPVWAPIMLAVSLGLLVLLPKPWTRI